MTGLPPIVEATPGAALIVGFGVTGQAVARALRARGARVVAVDDHPRPDLEQTAESLGVNLVAAPTPVELEQLVADADLLLPGPGLPDHHAVFAVAATIGVPVASEFDLARIWDDRPIAAITGTDGKTTVTTLVTRMLRRAGIDAVDSGNTDTPLVSAIENPSTEWFVVEASSFRLGHSQSFRPRVATWLNMGTDHLDAHRDHDAYVAAKARIWADLPPGAVAVANAEDATVMAHVPAGAEAVTFGLDTGDYHQEGGRLVDPSGTTIVEVDRLPRRFAHDRRNALAAAATAAAAGADPFSVADVLVEFTGLPHRVELVGRIDDIAWYDDSKATTPNATLAALESFDSAVLIAGGRNKGIDLGVLAEAAPRVRAVVAIGDAAPAIVDVFDGAVPVTVADSMDAAVSAAALVARPGDAVVLSPSCASFDWYRSYGERGDDFARAVRELVADGRDTTP